MVNLSIEQTQEQARRLLDSRIASVTGLVTARQRVADLKEKLADAERESKRAYVRATKDGWTPEELKKLGLENPTATRRYAARKKPARTASRRCTGGRIGARLTGARFERFNAGGEVQTRSPSFRAVKRRKDQLVRWSFLRFPQQKENRGAASSLHLVYRPHWPTAFPRRTLWAMLTVRRLFLGGGVFFCIL